MLHSKEHEPSSFEAVSDGWCGAGPYGRLGWSGTGGCLRRTTSSSVAAGPSETAQASRLSQTDLRQVRTLTCQRTSSSVAAS